jgi:prevent-host-death family protein
MRAGVSELKAGLSHYLERVRDGHEIVVTDRGQPVRC